MFITLECLKKLGFPNSAYQLMQINRTPFVQKPLCSLATIGSSLESHPKLNNTKVYMNNELMFHQSNRLIISPSDMFL
jgi:hypothetical protein